MTNPTGDCSQSARGEEDREGKLLCMKIKAKLEDLLSDSHLAEDGFLLKHVQRDKQGHVSLKLLTCLKKIKALTTNWYMTLAAAEASDLLAVNEERTKVRRIEPLPRWLLCSPTSKLLLAWNICVRKTTEEDVAPRGQEQARLSESVLQKFSPHGSVTSLWVLYPGSKLPKELQCYAKRHKELGQHLCAVVKFDHLDEVRKAYKALKAEEIRSNGEGMSVVPLGIQAMHRVTSDQPSDENNEDKPQDTPSQDNPLDASEDPAREDPAREDPAREDPAREDPAQEDSAQEDPAREDPAREDPAREDPAREDPAREDPAQQDPAQEDPAREDSAQEDPAQEDPAREDPAREDPAREDPAREDPAREDPAREDPAQEDPAREEASAPPKVSDTCPPQKSLNNSTLISTSCTGRQSFPGWNQRFNKRSCWSGDCSNRNSQSPWVQSRKFAASALNPGAADSGNAPAATQRVLRQPRGPEGTEGFHSRGGAAAPSNSPRGKHLPLC
ncbi:uncharacterized protein ACO6RY_13858 [Pungitius sinensis]